jgi:hypothetical protein
MIRNALADHRQLSGRTHIAQHGGAPDKVKRRIPVLIAADAKCGQNCRELQSVGVVPRSSILDQLDGILRRERRITADEQSPAKLILRPSVASGCTLLQ